MKLFNRLLLGCLFTTVVFSAPILELDGADSVDLGTFESRLAKQVTFKIKNSGDAILKIDKVRKTCGCLKVKHFPKELAPGESGEVNISIAAYGLKASFSKLVFVSSNDSKNKIKQLSITGKAIPLYHVSPNTKFNVGNLVFKENSTPKEFQFLITPVGKQHLDLENPVVSLSKGVKASLVKTSDNKSFKLNVSLSSELKKGMLRLKVEVPVKAPKGWKPVEVILYGRVK